MKRFARLKPSPAMAVALLSLFVAMSGVGYAAATIGSGQIKNNSIRGKDIRNSSVTGKDVKNNGLTGKDIKNIKGADVTNDSLTGSDVNEGSLGVVPNANLAATAQRAASAASSDQVKSISLASDDGDPARTILKMNGLTLTGTCDEIEATTDEAHSYISSYTSDDGDEDQDLDFGTGASDAFDVDQGHSQNTVEHYNMNYATPTGRTVSMYFTTVENGDGPIFPGSANEHACDITGVAVGS